MARSEKPYRVYRGGRAKGKVPTIPRPAREPRRERRRAAPPEHPAAPRPRRLTPRRILVLLVLLLVALLAAWAVFSYLAFSRGVDAANARLEDGTRGELAAQDGLLLSKPTVILLLGTDFAPGVEARRGAQRSDSVMLVRTDPGRNRLAFLSIPRDLRVPIPGRGFGKVNAAFQAGGAPLAIRTIRGFTGIPVNHVAIVDFGSFRRVIDAVGGITVNVPRRILSNRFDCPYAPDRCGSWPGWRFERGPQEMNGKRALVYARVRQNRLDPSETDLTRAERQQAVVEAIARKLLRPTTLARMPWIGEDVMRPLATDLSSRQLLQLGWRKFRVDDSKTLHCRLGGEPASVGGESVLIAEADDNLETILMFTGRSAPQRPPRGAGPFAPGCVVGSARSL